MSRQMISFKLDEDTIARIDKLITPLNTRSDILREAVNKFVGEGITKDELGTILHKILQRLNTLEGNDV